MARPCRHQVTKRMMLVAVFSKGGFFWSYNSPLQTTSLPPFHTVVTGVIKYILTRRGQNKPSQIKRNKKGLFHEKQNVFLLIQNKQ